MCDPRLFCTPPRRAGAGTVCNNLKCDSRTLISGTHTSRFIWGNHRKHTDWVLPYSTWLHQLGTTEAVAFKLSRSCGTPTSRCPKHRSRRACARGPVAPWCKIALLRTTAVNVWAVRLALHRFRTGSRWHASRPGVSMHGVASGRGCQWHGVRLSRRSSRAAVRPPAGVWCRRWNDSRYGMSRLGVCHQRLRPGWLWDASGQAVPQRDTPSRSAICC